MMESTSNMAQVLTDHADLISAMSTFYHTLMDLDYLRDNEVQFPPHAGEDKVPLATVSIQSADLTEEAEHLLQFLPYITESGAELMQGEAAITLSSQPVSHLYKGSDQFDDGERFFGYADEGEMPSLPLWTILLFSASHRDQHVVIYDTRSSTRPTSVRCCTTANPVTQKRSQSSPYMSPPSTNSKPQPQP